MVKLEISDLVVFEAVLGHLFWTPMATHLSARFKNLMRMRCNIKELNNQ